MRVRSIHAQNRPAERGRAGERCALNLAGERVTREAFARGDVVLDPALHAPTERIDASCACCRASAGRSGSGSRCASTPRRRRPGRGSCCWATSRSRRAARPSSSWCWTGRSPPRRGTAIVVRDTSAQRTIGGGRLVDLRAPARKRRSPERLAQLAALALDEPEAALAALLAVPPRLVDLAGFGRDRALGTDRMEELADRLGLVRIAAAEQLLALTAEDWTRLTHGLLETLDGFHRDNPDLPGIGFERLRLQSQPRLPAPAFAGAAARAGAGGPGGAGGRLGPADRP